jgi:hypothetical protein
MRFSKHKGRERGTIEGGAALGYGRVPHLNLKTCRPDDQEVRVVNVRVPPAFPQLGGANTMDEATPYARFGEQKTVF